MKKKDMRNKGTVQWDDSKDLRQRTRQEKE